MADESTNEDQGNAFKRIQQERDELRSKVANLEKVAVDTVARTRVFDAVVQKVPNASAADVDFYTTTVMPHVRELEGEALTDALNTKFGRLFPSTDPAPAPDDAPVPAADITPSTPGFASPAGDGVPAVEQIYDDKSPEWRAAEQRNDKAWFQKMGEAGRLRYRFDDSGVASRGA